jgi:hypothetical protein
MNLRKEIRRTLKEVRIKQEVNVKIEFIPDDAGSGGYFKLEEDGHPLVRDQLTFDETLKIFRQLLKNMASNSL